MLRTDIFDAMRIRIHDRKGPIASVSFPPMHQATADIPRSIGIDYRCPPMESHMSKTPSVIIQENRTLLFIGDSITDCERSRPVGEGRGGALGKGYVQMIETLLQIDYPELNSRVINMGISGNTSRDLRNRWATDVETIAPQWIIVMVGANDAWRDLHSPHRRDLLVDPNEYRSNLEEIVSRARQGKETEGVILMTPFYISQSKSDPAGKRIKLFAAIMRKVADRHRLPLIDIQAAMDLQLRARHFSAIARDHIHPESLGHLIIARAFLSCLEAQSPRRQTSSRAKDARAGASNP